MDAPYQAALEALVGRALTQDEVAQIEPWLPPRRDDLIAELLSAGRVKYVETRKVEIGVIGAYPGGPVEADALLAKLELYADAAQPLSRLVGRALKAMNNEPGLNFGDQSTHQMLDALAQYSVITAGEAAGLKAIALVDDPISLNDVSKALNKVTYG